jgi:putative protease
MDRMMEAGVRVFKIEGRARGPEYVSTVVSAYNEAINAVLNDTFTEELKDQLDTQLATVFNRGFWDGYYQGQTLGEWNNIAGSAATVKKVYCAKTIRYFTKLGVAEFKIEACELKKGDKILITGPTTGALYCTADEIRYDLEPVDVAKKGQHVSIAVPRKVRRSDKLYVIVENDPTVDKR